MKPSWWPANIDPDAVWWSDYRAILDQLPADRFPDCKSLNQLLPECVCSAGDQPIRFVDSAELAANGYENRIFNSGRVSTRADSWHDLFNAMVWLRFPHIKIAMNALHQSAEPRPDGRGQLRDALTLFDECGVLVVSSHRHLLHAISNHDWEKVFQSPDCAWNRDVRVAVCGHAMLEKLLTPYKSMTAKALLIEVPPPAMALQTGEFLARLDQEIGKQLLQRHALTQPAQLTPLPLAGIPGWDFAGQQDEKFYRDTDVFRPPPARARPAHALKIEL